MAEVQVRFAREFGWLEVMDMWGEWHTLRSSEAPKWMVRTAMDAKKSAALRRREREAA